ncbi:MAG: ChaN family lipoprotein [Bacteroidota bacterium]
MKYNKYLSVSILSLLFVLAVAMKADKAAYQFFDQKGNTTDYNDLFKDAKNADIVFFGEMHDNPICHWLERELARDLYNEKKELLVLGAEMFEADNQLLLSEYLSGTVKTRSFEDEVKLWKNYKTDYKPLIEFAKSKKIPFIATNIPRRYASIVFSKGFKGLDSLSAMAKTYIAPLPFPYVDTLKNYKIMLSEKESIPPGYDSTNYPKAQAAKDATMAHFILKNWSKGKVFLHFNGTYHSEDFEGIVWYLKHASPELRIVTISSCEQESIDELKKDQKGKADYILVVPERMTKTYP